MNLEKTYRIDQTIWWSSSGNSSSSCFGCLYRYNRIIFTDLYKYIRRMHANRVDDKIVCDYLWYQKKIGLPSSSIIIILHRDEIKTGEEKNLYPIYKFLVNLEKNVIDNQICLWWRQYFKKNLVKHHTYEEWIMADHHSDTTVYDDHQLQKQNKKILIVNEIK